MSASPRIDACGGLAAHLRAPAGAPRCRRHGVILEIVLVHQRDCTAPSLPFFFCGCVFERRDVCEACVEKAGRARKVVALLVAKVLKVKPEPCWFTGLDMAGRHDIGRSVCAARQDAGLSQAALQRELGLRPAFLSEFESGTMSRDKAAVQSVARRLGLMGLLLRAGGQV